MKNNKQVFAHIIIHQHWDPAWIARRKDTQPQLIALFDDLLKKMIKHPSFKFVLDGQTHIVEDFIQQLPQREKENKIRMIRKFSKERRLMIGPFYSQVDWNLASGELLVRNALIGHREAELLGGIMKAGWVIDVFGYPEATVKILRGFNIPNVFLSRGVGIEPEKVRDAYKWMASDGSSVICFHLIESYRNLMNLSETPEIAQQRILGKVDLLLQYSSTGKHVLLFDGYENQPKADDIVPIIEKIGKSVIGYNLLITTPEDYSNSVERENPRLSVIKGNLNSGKYIASLQGVFSNRVYLKKKQGECQQIIERWLEPFSTFNYCLGGGYHKEQINELWKTLLRISCHDEICGCSIDDVHKDAEIKYDEILKKANLYLESILSSLSNNVELSCNGKENGFILFNASQYNQKGIIKTVIEVPESLDSFYISGLNGEIIPYQVSKKEGNKWEVYLWAENVSPLGFTPYWFVSAEKEASFRGASAKRNLDKTGTLQRTISNTLKINKENKSIENSFVRVVINTDGSFNITDKVSKKTYRNLNYFKDEGDRGDLYTASCIKDNVVRSLRKKATIKLVKEGPLVACFKVELNLLLPDELKVNRRERSKKLKRYKIICYIELKADSPRVDIKTIIFNVIKDHRLRVCFPTGLKADYFYVEKQFDVEKSPIEIDKSGYSKKLPPLKGIVSPAWDTVAGDCYAHQSFIDISDGEKGLSLISKHLPEFFVAKKNKTIELTLLRGVGWLGLDDLPVRKGRAGWLVRVPDAQCLGIHTFEYALFPHKYDWLRGNVHKEVEKFVFDLKAVNFQHSFANEKNLKKSYCKQPQSVKEKNNSVFCSTFGFINIQPFQNSCLILTAIKLSEDGKGIIIRLYNPTLKKVIGKIEFNYPRYFNKQKCLHCLKGVRFKSAFYTNLNEEVEKEIKLASDKKVPIIAEPKKIITVKVEIGWSKGLKEDTFTLTSIKSGGKISWQEKVKNKFWLINLPLKEKEEKVQLITPQLIDKKRLNSEKKRVEEATLEFNKEKKILKEIEKKYSGSIIVSEKMKIEKQRMKVFRLTEKLQDAKYSYLLSLKKYYEELRKNNQIRKIRDEYLENVLGEEELNKKIRLIQNKIDLMARDLIKPRAERQRQEFIIEYYQEILKNKKV